MLLEVTRMAKKICWCRQTHHSMATIEVSSDTMCKLQSASTFFCKASILVSSSAFAHIPLKQCRMSLTLPSSPATANSFQDGTRLESHTTGALGLMPETRDEVQQITNDGERDISEPSTEKKQKKKWTDEETQMLADGCNTVSSISFYSTLSSINHSLVGHR